MSAIMDYPAAWVFIRGTKPEDHHELCSWRTESGALLCDCDVLWDEYVRRGGIDPRPCAQDAAEGDERIRLARFAALNEKAGT